MQMQKTANESQYGDGPAAFNPYKYLEEQRQGQGKTVTANNPIPNPIPIYGDREGIIPEKTHAIPEEEFTNSTKVTPEPQIDPTNMIPVLSKSNIANVQKLRNSALAQRKEKLNSEITLLNLIKSEPDILASTDFNELPGKLKMDLKNMKTDDQRKNALDEYLKERQAIAKKTALTAVAPLFHKAVLSEGITPESTYASLAEVKEEVQQNYPKADFAPAPAKASEGIYASLEENPYESMTNAKVPLITKSGKIISQLTPSEKKENVIQLSSNINKLRNSKSKYAPNMVILKKLIGVVDPTTHLEFSRLSPVIQAEFKKPNINVSKLVTKIHNSFEDELKSINSKINNLRTERSKYNTRTNFSPVPAAGGSYKKSLYKKKTTKKKTNKKKKTKKQK